MVAGLLLNLALRKVQAISAVPAYCKRMRFRHSDCRKCVDICPEHAITLPMGPSINEDCSNCGLCLNVCPIEAFQSDVNTDQFFLDQMLLLRSKDQGSGKKKRVFIHCQEAEAQNEDSLGILCLGNITENIILGGALLGIDEVILTKGTCSRCHLAQGERLLNNCVNTSRALIESIGIKGFSLRVQEQQKDKEKESRLSRRAFFSRIVRNAKDNAARVEYIKGKDDPDSLHRKLETKDEKRPSPRRELLRKLLNQKQWDNANVATTSSTFPWKKMQVDEKHCIACGICVAVCPTGALEKKYEHSQLVRSINNALCTNCSLCQEACPQDVISFRDNFHVTDITEDKTTEVARVDLIACAICGEIIPAGNSKVCPTCEKRQISPITYGCFEGR